MYVIEPFPEWETKIYLCCCGSRSRVFYGLEDLCANLTLDFVEKFVGRNYGDLIKIVTERANGLVWDDENRKFGYKNPEKFYNVEADFILRKEDGEKLFRMLLRESLRFGLAVTRRTSPMPGMTTKRTTMRAGRPSTRRGRDSIDLSSTQVQYGTFPGIPVRVR